LGRNPVSWIALMPGLFIWLEQRGRPWAPRGPRRRLSARPGAQHAKDQLVGAVLEGAHKLAACRSLRHRGISQTLLS